MNTFPIIATVLSMFLGLSVTRLLLGFVTVFRIRRTSTVDWVSLTWGGILFLVQLEFWWAINQLPNVEATFRFSDFIFLVVLTLMLFLTAAILLPNRIEDEADGLRSYFEQDGRFALIPLSAFLVLGAILNITFFKEPIGAEWAVLDIPMIVLPIVAFFAKARRIYAGITLLYLPLLFVDTWISLAS